MNSTARVGVLLCVVLVTGCSFKLEATGSVVMLQGAVPEKAISVDAVQIFLEAPTEPYRAIALVSSSVGVDYRDIAAAEGAALLELKRQTALAGGNGIIDLVREVLVGDTLVSTSRFHSLPELGLKDQRRLAPIKQVSGTSQTSVSTTYTLYFRGKAIQH